VRSSGVYGLRFRSGQVRGEVREEVQGAQRRLGHRGHQGGGAGLVVRQACRRAVGAAPRGGGHREDLRGDPGLQQGAAGRRKRRRRHVARGQRHLGEDR
jgi:hypothetical protein